MTLRAESGRKAVILSWRASRTVLGRSFLELVGPLFFSMSALVASLLSITEIAFFEAILLFTSSFLSLASRFFSFSKSITLLWIWIWLWLWLWLLSLTVKAFGFSGLEEESTGLVVARRLNDAWNEWVRDSEAMNIFGSEALDLFQPNNSLTPDSTVPF